MIQGVLAAAALYLLGVRYAILLGVWVSITAIIPYLGAFLGGIPAVIVALVFGSSNFESSTTTAILTIVAYVLIQQLEGNFLTPRIQGQALQVHPILVLLAVIAGGELAGLAGIVFAVPTLAVFRVLSSTSSGSACAENSISARSGFASACQRPTLLVSKVWEAPRIATIRDRHGRRTGHRES